MEKNERVSFFNYICNISFKLVSRKFERFSKQPLYQSLIVITCLDTSTGSYKLSAEEDTPSVYGLLTPSFGHK